MRKKRLTAAIILFTVICLITACQAPEAPVATTGETESTSEQVSTVVETTTEEIAEETVEVIVDEVPYGKPFIATLDAGNLPESKGSPADDINIYYNYDFFKENDDPMVNSMYMMLASGEFKENVIKYIEDESISAPGADQLRLFYKQAMDMETADAKGVQEVMPYIDMIDSADSIEAFNKVLTSQDFPFTPFLTAILWGYDNDAENIYALYPNYLFYDFLNGAEFLQDTEDPDEKANIGIMTLTNMPKFMLEGKVLSYLGYEDEQEVQNISQSMQDFEKAYGKYAYYDNKALKTEYGELGQFYNLLTFDELGKRFKNFPVTGMLAKDGRDKSKFYEIMSVEWMDELDKIWTAENLETLKMMAKVKVFMECAPFLNSDLEASVAAIRNTDLGLQAQQGDVELNLTDRAYGVCDSLDTFGQLIAKIYVDNYVGAAGKARLEKMAEDLREAYIRIFNKTTWLDEDSREVLMEKLDKMGFNILEPEGGYFDYSGLELVSTEEGGSLLGNYLLLKKYRMDKENEMIGKDADSGFVFFAVKPSTMNCFYAPEGNCINILPGFINSGIYADSYSDEEVLGGIGYVVAHEISHGFDNLGSQYDGRGMLNICFTPEVQDTYLDLCNKVKEYYDGIYVSGGKYVDGKKVLAEACADLCGMDAIIECSENYDNFDYEKFYQRVALIYRDLATKGAAGLMLIMDTHPLGYLRINVNVQMNDKFYEIYDAKEGDNMYVAPENRLYLYGK